MKYKVGDRVKIKSFDWYDSSKKNNYGIKLKNRYFTIDMAQFCSKEATIEALLRDCYLIDIDGGEFNWDDEMFEELKKKHKHKNIKNMKYKIGDKVKIKSLNWYENSEKDGNDIWCEKNYFTSTMAKFCGREAVIKLVFDTGYKIDIDGGFYNWCDDMFEEPKKKRKHKNKKNIDNCKKEDLPEEFRLFQLIEDAYRDILRGENNLKVEIPHFTPNDVKTPNSDAEIFKSITDKMLETFIKKNHDYGGSFEKGCDEDGLVSARCRLRDKWERFKKLSSGELAQVKDESIRDTLLDLANYCIMTVMWLDKKNLEDKE